MNNTNHVNLEIILEIRARSCFYSVNDTYQSGIPLDKWKCVNVLNTAKTYHLINPFTIIKYMSLETAR